MRRSWAFEERLASVHIDDSKVLVRVSLFLAYGMICVICFPLILLVVVFMNLVSLCKSPSTFSIIIQIMMDSNRP